MRRPRWLVPALLGLLLSVSLGALADLGVGVGLLCTATTCSIPGAASFVSAPAHQAGGTTFTLGAGTGACATSSTLTGGSSGGSFLCTGTAGASTQVVNLPTAPHGWACWANDDTSKVAWAAGGATASATTLSGTLTTTSDKVSFGCLAF